MVYAEINGPAKDIFYLEANDILGLDILGD